MKMKKLFLSLICLASPAALACPNLSGQFTCKDFETGAAQEITMSQSTVNGVTNYKLEMVVDGQSVSVDYVADGQPKNVAREEYHSRTEKSYCRGNELVKEIQGTLKEGGTVLSAVETMKIAAGGGLYNSYVGKFGEEAMNFEEVCQRK
jgi:hypothetical protein